jgi:hypothetical protein
VAAVSKLIRTDQTRPGDLILGTRASGDYENGPRRLDRLEPAAEHSQRMQAYWLIWTDGSRLCYYGDTQVWLGQRP